jgi:hypothetical protein
MQTDLNHNLTPMPATSDRWPVVLAVLVVGLLALSIWPLWAGDWLPLHDAAQIEHQASVIYDWNVHAALRRDFERVPWPTPNWLGISLITLLAPIGGVHVATKLLLSGCLVALLVACWDLLRTARHSAWLLLAVVPWLWNQEVFVGHLASIVGFPLFILLLSAHLQFLRAPRAVGALRLAALGVLLALSNLLLWCLAVLLVPVLTLAYGWRPTVAKVAIGQRLRTGAIGLLRETALFLPSLALLLPWYRRAVASEGGLQALRGEWALPMDAVKSLLLHMFDVFAPRGAVLESVSDLLFNRPGDVITALWLLGMALWVTATAVEARRRSRVLDEAAAGSPAGEGSVAAQVLASADGSWYLGWAFLLISVAYFSWPLNILQPVWIHGWSPRLVTLMALVGVLALPLRPADPAPAVRWRTWLGTAALGVAALWMPLAALRSTVLVQHEFSYLREAMDAVPEGKSLLVLRPSPDSRWMQMRIFHPIGQYFAVLRGGSVPYGFIDPALQPVRPRDGRLRPSPPGDDHEAFTWHDHGRFYDFVAVFRDSFGAEPKYEALLRSWPCVYQRGRWQVFHNVHPFAWTPQQALRVSKPSSLDAQVADAVLELTAGWLGYTWDADYLADGNAQRRFAVMLRKLGWPTTADTAVVPSLPPAVRAAPAAMGPAGVAAPPPLPTPQAQPPSDLPLAVSPTLHLAPLLRDLPRAPGHRKVRPRPPSRDADRGDVLP